MAPGDGAARCESRVASEARPGQERLGRVCHTSGRVMTKRDIDRAQERRRRDLKILAADEAFQQAVYLLRRVLNVSPDTRRHVEGVIRQELGPPHRLDPNIHNAALNKCLFDLLGGGIHTDDDQQAHKRMVADVSYGLIRQGLKNLPSLSLEAALFMDFDRSEFEMWADEVRPTRLAYWYDYVVFLGDRQDWKRHSAIPLTELVKFKRIWLDVTERDVAWLHEVWPEIERMQEMVKSKPPPLKRGRPPRVPARRETVLGKTWEEIRAEIRQAPSYCTRWENRYVDAEVGRREKKWLAEQRGSTEVPPRLARQWRRQAKDNFYHQVIVHSSMRDLNLRSRQKGRRRKS